MKDKKRFIITGVQGNGKTTFCHALVDMAHSAGWDVAGVLSPPVMEDGNKIGIDIVDLHTKQRKRLANTIDQRSDGPRTTRWAFDGEVLSWGNQVLGNVPACDLFVIDELGPLEFERGEGWLNGISAIGSGEYKWAIIVVRPWLVDKALEMWPDSEVFKVDSPAQAGVLAEKFFQDFLA